MSSTTPAAGAAASSDDIPSQSSCSLRPEIPLHNFGIYRAQSLFLSLFLPLLLLCSLISFATWQIFVQPFRNSQRLPEQPHPGYLPVVIGRDQIQLLYGAFQLFEVKNTQSKFAIWLNRFCIMRWLRLKKIIPRPLYDSAARTAFFRLD